ncbi:imine reductase family protein [Streptomyces sp. NPDC003710]
MCSPSPCTAPRTPSPSPPRRASPRGAGTVRGRDQRPVVRGGPGAPTVASAAATLTRLVGAAEAHGLDTGALAAAKRAADRAVADGHGPDGLARLVTAVAATGATAGVPGPPIRG